MKNSITITSLICVLLVYCACPAFAQYGGSTPGSSLSQTGAPQFNAPNYWGDSRVKNRSTAASPQGSTTAPMSGGRSSGGGGSNLGMLMGPAMMLPMMVMGRGFGRGYRPHQPKQQNDDDDQKPKRQKKKSSRAAQQQTVNDENSLPDPLYPTQGISSLSKKTLDLQSGNAQPMSEDQKMKVYGNMQDDEGPAPAMNPANSTFTAPQMASEAPPLPETIPITESATVPTAEPGADF